MKEWKSLSSVSFFLDLCATLIKVVQTARQTDYLTSSKKAKLNLKAPILSACSFVAVTIQVFSLCLSLYPSVSFCLFLSVHLLRLHLCVYFR